MSDAISLFTVSTKPLVSIQLVNKLECGLNDFAVDAHLASVNYRPSLKITHVKTIRKLAKSIQISQKTACNHMHTIGKSRQRVKRVPHDMNENHKLCKYEICTLLFLRNHYLYRIVICDEK